MLKTGQGHLGDGGRGETGLDIESDQMSRVGETLSKLTWQGFAGRGLCRPGKDGGGETAASSRAGLRET